MLLHRSCPLTVLLLTTGVSTIVLPPENVTVSCHNLKTTVNWSYTNQPAPITFALVLNTDGLHKEVVARENWYDVSDIIWKTPETLYSLYRVQISATDGTEKSEKVYSSFTFNSVKTADITCKLDLPPTNLVLEHGKGVLSFPNPHHFYKELLRSHHGQVHPIYEFTVSTSEGDNTQHCTTKEAVCRLEIVVPDSKEQCVELQGTMISGDRRNIVQFKTNNSICARQMDSQPHLLIMVILMAFFAISTIVISLVIWRTGAWKTRPVLLNNLASKFSSSQGEKMMAIPHENISKIIAVTPALNQHSSVALFISVDSPTETTGESSNARPSSSTSPGHSYTDWSLVDSNQQMSEDAQAEILTSSTEEEEEEKLESPYDTRHWIEVPSGERDIL